MASLQETEDKAQQTIENFVKDRDSNFTQQEPNITIPQNSEQLTMESLTDLIENLHINADQRMGIIRYESNDPVEIAGNNKSAKVVIRDSTNQPPNENNIKYDHLPDTFQMSMAATARGALHMVENSNNSDDTKKVMKAEIAFFLKTGMAESKESEGNIDKSMKNVRSFEENIVNKLFENGINIEGVKTKKDIVKMLQDSRDICNLQDPQPHQATVFRGHNGDIRTTFATRVAAFSEEHIADFKKIKANEETPEWFNGLKPRQQKLIRDNIDKLIENDKTLATSLRFIPGLRNAHAEMEFCTHDGLTECYDRSIRTGTVAYTEDKSNPGQDVTSKNLAHLEEVCNGKEVNFQMYNHNFGDEHQIVQRTQKAFEAKKTNAMEAKFASSNAKTQEGREEGAQTKPAPKLFNIPLQFKFDKSAAFKQIREACGRSGKTGINVFSCKSGKDRTEAGRRVSREAAYQNNLAERDISLTQEQKKSVATDMINAGHGANISGGSGGNHGSLGLKTAPMLTFIGKIVKLGKEASTLLQANLLKNKVSKLNKMKVGYFEGKKAIKKEQSQGASR